MIDKIYNEDCIDVMKRIKKKSIDLTITDPPYGISFKSNRQGRDGRSGKDVKTGKHDYFDEIYGDDKAPTEWASMLYEIHKKNTAVYCFAHWRTDRIIVRCLSEAGFKVKSKIIMVKSNHGMGDLRGQYAPKYEILVYAVKGRHILQKRLPDVFFVPVIYSGSRKLHPNQKPVSWIEPFINNSSAKGEVVFDPFIGSGTTAVAAISLGRHFIGCEIDLNYYNDAIDVIKRTPRRLI